MSTKEDAPGQMGQHGLQQPGQQSRAIPLQQKARLSHTPAEWARIRPRLTYLYITLDKTLRECMAELQEQQSFVAR